MKKYKQVLSMIKSKLSCANTYPLHLGPSEVKQLRKTELKHMKTMYKINLFIFNYFHSKQGNVLIFNCLGILYKGQSLNVKVKQGNIPI